MKNSENPFQAQISTIKGLSEQRRLPRLGSIRLGIKAKNAKGAEYPKETDYFVCPLEVQKIVGETPKVLSIMLPLNDLYSVFPQAYVLYGSSKGLLCKGDGVKAQCVNPKTKEFEQIECPCNKRKTPTNPSGDCKPVGTLMVMIPDVSMGGIFQIRTSSYNSIIDINSGIEYVQSLLGRIDMIPLTLKRELTETHHAGKKQNHYTLKVILDVKMEGLKALMMAPRQQAITDRLRLPEPDLTDPALDVPDIKEWSKTQKTVLHAKLTEKNVAKEAMSDFISFCRKQYGLEESDLILEEVGGLMIDNFNSLFDDFLQTSSDNMESQPEQPEYTENPNSEFQEKALAFKKVLGDKKYFGILGDLGFEKVEEIGNPGMREIFLSRLQEAVDDQ